MRKITAPTTKFAGHHEVFEAPDDLPPVGMQQDETRRRQLQRQPEWCGQQQQSREVAILSASRT